MTQAEQSIVNFVRSLGLGFTRFATGGSHSGAGHAQHRAVDVGVRGYSDSIIDKLISSARGEGYAVLDERTRPPGRAYRFWTGPNVHIEIPQGGVQSDQALGGQESSGSAAPGEAAPLPPVNNEMRKLVIMGAATIVLLIAAFAVFGKKL